MNPITFIAVATLALIHGSVAQLPGGAGAASSFLASNPDFNSAAAGAAGQSSWATSGGLGAQNLANQGQFNNIQNAQAAQLGSQQGVWNGAQGVPSTFYPGAGAPNAAWAGNNGWAPGAGVGAQNAAWAGNNGWAPGAGVGAPNAAWAGNNGWAPGAGAPLGYGR